MRHHDPFLNHVKVRRSGTETEEALTIIDHREPGLNPNNGSILAVCVDGLAIHLTVRQSKALRKVLKALEVNT